MAPTWSQIGVKMVPSWFQLAQDALKIAARWARIAQGGPEIDGKRLQPMELQCFSFAMKSKLAYQSCPKDVCGCRKAASADGVAMTSLCDEIETRLPWVSESGLQFWGGRVGFCQWFFELSWAMLADVWLIWVYTTRS
jgi:hypothetical protein